MGVGLNVLWTVWLRSYSLIVLGNFYFLHFQNLLKCLLFFSTSWTDNVSPSITSLNSYRNNYNVEKFVCCSGCWGHAGGICTHDLL